MKRKKKKKEQKKRKEAMRKRFCTDSTSGPSTHRDNALSLGHVEHTKGLAKFYY